MSEELTCYIRDTTVRRRFCLKVSGKFLLAPPVHMDEGVIYFGPELEIERLKLFYEGMVFYDEVRR